MLVGVLACGVLFTCKAAILEGGDFAYDELVDLSRQVEFDLQSVYTYSYLNIYLSHSQILINFAICLVIYCYNRHPENIADFEAYEICVGTLKLLSLIVNVIIIALIFQCSSYLESPIIKKFL